MCHAIAPHPFDLLRGNRAGSARHRELRVIVSGWTERQVDGRGRGVEHRPQVWKRRVDPGRAAPLRQDLADRALSKVIDRRIGHHHAVRDHAAHEPQVEGRYDKRQAVKTAVPIDDGCDRSGVRAMYCARMASTSAISPITVSPETNPDETVSGPSTNGLTSPRLPANLRSGR